MPHREAASAVNRFGLGAKPGELDSVRDPRGWLFGQLGTRVQPAAFAGLPDSLTYLQREFGFNRERMARKRGRNHFPGDSMPEPLRRGGGNASDPFSGDIVEEFKMNFRDVFGDGLLAEIGARYRVATTTDSGFAERLVRFWSNHFAISIDKRPAMLYAAPMEREAIRPHVFGRFGNLLLAAETHPGMLRYLDNAQSVGEGSMFATRGVRRLERRQGGDAPKRRFGLNENLAREILELHTLGVDGGYSQADVTELARAITGWGTPLPREWGQSHFPGSSTPEPRRPGRENDPTSAAFVFRQAAHEPGARTVLDKRYAEGGEDQGRAVLADLARHPSTAKHLSFKLARHFVADDPPPALVARMAKAWLDSDGDLPTLYRTMIESDEAWSGDARKFKTPDDFLVSALRAGGIDAGARPRQVANLLNRLGQAVFMPRSPAGFADAAADWTGPDALFKRIQVSQALAERVPADRIDPARIGAAALGSALDEETTIALRRAESPRDGLALLFASPAFQWRV